MNRIFTIGIFTALTSPVVWSQQPSVTTHPNPPLYRVTVVERHVDAVNYQYRSGPTKIGFRGTVLMAKADGDAAVESVRGRTEITARFNRVLAPTRFGREYLTYVLWAITPEGSPHNLGEVVPGGSDRASLHVTTDLQSFGLIVTAEPYSSVRQPSDVVVMENEVRPETVGRIQPIQVKYELMSRGHYTWNVPSDGEEAQGPKVSMKEYETISQLYQAQNAIAIARAANADQLAADTFSAAERQLGEAERLRASKADSSLIIQHARAAAQTAEDARQIAERRANNESLAQAKAAAAAERDARIQSEAALARARADAEVARVKADNERLAREQGQATASPQQTTSQSTEPVQVEIGPSAPAPVAGQDAQKDARRRLLQDVSAVMETRDTPRGLVVSVTDVDFSGATLRPEYAGRLTRLATLLRADPRLKVEVEGHCDIPAGQATAMNRAYEVRDALLQGGLPAGLVTARGLADTRPISPNSTDAGRAANRRVEIVISGDSIGSVPVWDHTYTLSAR